MSGYHFDLKQIYEHPKNIVNCLILLLNLCVGFGTEYEIVTLPGHFISLPKIDSVNITSSLRIYHDRQHDFVKFRWL